MIFVHVMEIDIMQIVDMAFMAYCRMPAIGTVPVRNDSDYDSHCKWSSDFPFFLVGRRRLWRFGSMLDGAFHQTKDVSVGKRIVDAALPSNVGWASTPLCHAIAVAAMAAAGQKFA